MNWDLVIVIALKILAVIALVFMNGFFVATEFALVKVRLTQLEALAARQHKRAKMALHLAKHLDAYLSACQLGITLASLALGWIGEPIFEALLHPVFGSLGWTGSEWERVRSGVAFAVGFSVITFLHIVAGEQAPKSLAIKRPLEGALWVAYPLRWFYVLAYPFIWVLNHSALWLLRQLGIEVASEHEGVHSEEELRRNPEKRFDDLEKSYASRWRIDGGSWVRIGTDKDERVEILAAGTQNSTLEAHPPGKAPSKPGPPQLMAAYRALLLESKLVLLEEHRLEKILGSGGQGIVYLGERIGADGFRLPIALKVFSNQGASMSNGLPPLMRGNSIARSSPPRSSS